VKPSGAGPAFNPTLYGVHQQISVAIDLKDVNGIYKSYKHIQLIDFVLIAPGTVQSTNWTIGFEPAQDPMFGTGNYALTTFINQNLMKVNLTSDAKNRDEWLDRMYRRTKPLVDPSRESQAPDPDFFSIIVGSTEVQFPISQWNADLTNNQVLTNASTAFVKFFKRTADGDLQLAIAGLPVYQTN
jgi:hypothetical protein